VYACSATFEAGDPVLSAGLTGLLATLRGSSSNFTVSAQLVPFIAAAAGDSGVRPERVSLTLEVGPPFRTASSAPSNSSSGATTGIPLALILGVCLGGAAALLCLLLCFACLARRCQKDKRQPAPFSTGSAAEISGVNPMIAARASGTTAVMLSRPAVQKTADSAMVASMGRSPGAAASGARLAYRTAFGASERRVVGPPAQSHASVSHPKTAASSVSPLRRGRGVLPSHGTPASKQHPASSTEPGNPGSLDTSLGTFNSFKSNPLHRKQSRGASTGVSRAGRVSKKASGIMPSVTGTPMAAPDTSKFGDSLTMIDSPLRPRQAAASPATSVLQATGTGPVVSRDPVEDAEDLFTGVNPLRNRPGEQKSSAEP
jgi:hypothetical protein